MVFIFLDEFYITAGDSRQTLSFLDKAHFELCLVQNSGPLHSLNWTDGLLTFKLLISITPF